MKLLDPQRITLINQPSKFEQMLWVTPLQVVGNYLLTEMMLCVTTYYK